jgi:hypothetical protein
MLRLVAATAFAALSVSQVEGHGYISNPLPRAQTIPNHFYRNDPQSDGSRFADCRDGGQTGPVQVTWAKGATVTVEVVITANHGGWHEMRFCPDSRGGNSCFEEHLAIVSNPTSTPGCPTRAPPSSTHNGNCIPSPAESRFDLDPGCGTRNYTITLPPDLECEHCAMQWWWITDNFGNEHFKSCHDVRIVAGGGSPPTPSPGRPTPAPPNSPPNSPPTTPPPTPPPAPTPSPGGNCGLDISPNTDIFGSDLSSMDTVDEFQCCQQCENNSQCQAFTFVPSSVGWRQCYLKRAGGTVRNTPGMYSGFK